MVINNDRSATAPGAGVAQTLGVSQTKNRRRLYLKLAAIVLGIIVIAIVALQWLGDSDTQKIRYSTAEVTRGAGRCRCVSLTRGTSGTTHD